MERVEQLIREEAMMELEESENQTENSPADN